MSHEAQKTPMSESSPRGRFMLVLLSLLAVYFLGYLVLRLVGYFDLATLPWSSQERGWLYLLYWPLEWLRHL